MYDRVKDPEAGGLPSSDGGPCAIAMKSERRKRPSRPVPSGPIRAAEYVRMSTEHQQYSTENQHAAIQRYADEHGMLIVRTFTDAGKSGVGIHGRDALQELLRIVNSGAADFATILVYDVSRWGRFQDADEAAHYEFQCKRLKITVQY